MRPEIAAYRHSTHRRPSTDSVKKNRNITKRIERILVEEKVTCREAEIILQNALEDLDTLKDANDAKTIYADIFPEDCL